MMPQAACCIFSSLSFLAKAISALAASASALAIAGTVVPVDEPLVSAVMSMMH